MNRRTLRAVVAVSPLLAVIAIVRVALEFVPEWAVFTAYWACASVALASLYVKAKRKAAARAALLVAEEAA